MFFSEARVLPTSMLNTLKEDKVQVKAFYLKTRF